jgi:hypothetical protein
MNTPILKTPEMSEMSEISIIDEIASRWQGYKNAVYCESWMYEVIRHGDRNMDIDCGHPEDDETPHPVDGTDFAHAPHDIHRLLGIIANFQKEITDMQIEISLIPGGKEYLKAKARFEDSQ